MRAIRVQKATRWFESFQPEKLFRSLQRAGATEELARAVVGRISEKLTRSVTTADIVTRVCLELDQLDSRVAARYRLRRALLELGPEGYPFERYVAKIFARYGYTVLVNQHIPGRCISHEVDVSAQNYNRHLMIECKYHNRRGVQSDAKVAMYTWARFVDIRDRPRSRHRQGHRHGGASGTSGAGAPLLEENDSPFTEGWLVTNTKVTRDALAFCQCVGLKVLGWDEPPERSLQHVIESAGLYPITCLPRLGGGLPDLNQLQRRALLRHDLLLCQDLIEHAAELPRVGFSPAAAAQLVIAARQVVGVDIAPTLPPL